MPRSSFIRDVFRDVRHRKPFVDIINSARRRALSRAFSSGIFSGGSSIRPVLVREKSRAKSWGHHGDSLFSLFASLIAHPLNPSRSTALFWVSRVVAEKPFVNYLSSAWHDTSARHVVYSSGETGKC